MKQSSRDCLEAASLKEQEMMRLMEQKRRTAPLGGRRAMSEDYRDKGVTVVFVRDAEIGLTSSLTGR